MAFLIRKEISYMDFQVLKDVEGIAVKIPTVSDNLEIINVYSSSSTNFDYNYFKSLFLKEHALICGDFNASSTLWGSPNNDTRGRMIEHILDIADKMVLNAGALTRIHNTGESHIDLGFASPFANKTCWKDLDHTGSDHNMISITMDCPVTYENLYNPKWIFKKANWSCFSSLCDNYLT